MDLPAFSDPAPDPRSTEGLISEILSLSEKDDEYWDLVFILRRRATREVLDRSVDLAAGRCPAERSLGASILGQLGLPDRAFPDESLGVLLRMLGAERDSSTLSSILAALGHLRHPSIVAAAGPFARHAEADVRHGAVHALMGYDDPVAIRAMIGLTRDADGDVRNWACFALGSPLIEHLDTEEIRDALADRLDDAHDEARGEAFLALAERRDRRVIPPLLGRLAGDDVFSMEVEAASIVAEPCLRPALVGLRAWWDVDPGLLERAIDACTPAPSVGP